jgi:hypothetical protein
VLPASLLTEPFDACSQHAGRVVELHSAILSAATDKEHRSYDDVPRPYAGANRNRLRPHLTSLRAT